MKLIVCVACLILQAINKRFARLAPMAAIGIAVEMLLFCGVQLYAGDMNYKPIVYWLVVAAIAAFIAYGRLVLKPSAQGIQTI